MKSRTWVAAGATIVVGMTAAGSAHAQYWLQDRALQEGRGLRAGNFEFHPGVGAEFGYDSNVFLRPNNDTTGPGVVSALRLRVTPSLTLSTLGMQRSAAQSVGTTGMPSALPTVNFRANAALVYQHFFPISAGASDRVKNLSNLGGQAGVRLELFPGRTWQFNIYDDFSRVVAGGPDVLPTLYIFNAIRNTAGFDLVYAPNGGIVDLRLTYQNRLSFFENPDFRFYSYMINEIALRNRWRFLPKTSLMWEGVVSPSFYFNPAGSSTGLFPSVPVRTRLGVNGLLTERLGLLVMAGYQGTYFYNPNSPTGLAGDNADTFIGQVEMKYIIGPTQSFQLGVQRDVQPSLIGNFYIRNRLYAQYSQSFAGRFWLSAEASGGYLQFGYPSALDGAPAPGRIQGGDDPIGRYHVWRLQGLLFGEYRFTDWFGLNATASAYANLSDASLITNLGGAGPAAPLSLQWNKFEAYIGARVAF